MSVNHDFKKVYEIYTKNPETGEGGWDIEFVRTTPDKIKSFPHFDEIITVNDCNNPALIIDF